jgi:hypothetical protein
MNTFRNLFASSLLTLSFAATAIAADDGRPARRLESVTWTPSEHKLTWVVAEGTLADKKFQGSKKTTFMIRMDEALMSLEGEDRRFSKAEAVSVHRLMDMVAKYAAESTVWWESGEGEPVQKGGSQVDRKKDDPGAGDLDNLVPRRRTQPDREKGGKVIRISVEEEPLPAQLQTVE